MEGPADEFGNISGYTDKSILTQRIAGNPCVKDESGAPWILPIASDIEGFIIKSYMHCENLIKAGKLIPAQFC